MLQIDAAVTNPTLKHHHDFEHAGATYVIVLSNRSKHLVSLVSYVLHILSSFSFRSWGPQAFQVVTFFSFPLFPSRSVLSKKVNFVAPLRSPIRVTKKSNILWLFIQCRGRRDHSFRSLRMCELPEAYINSLALARRQSNAKSEFKFE